MNEGNDDAHLREPAASLIKLMVTKGGHSVVVIRYGAPPPDPIIYLAPGMSPAGVLAAIDQVGEENLQRYAEQQGISMEEAMKQAAKRHIVGK